MIESFKLPNITPESLTGSIVSFNDEYGNLPLKSCTSLISGYQEGSGIPSPDNVRNFVGYSEININACGVNIVSIADRASSTENGITSEITNSKLVASGQSTGNGDIKVLFNKPLIIKQGMTIYFSIDGTDNRSSLLFVFLHRKGGGYLSPTSIPNTSHSITLTTEGVYDHMLLRTTINQTVNIDAYIMIGTSTEYVPYVGKTYTFTFGQSIYQGSIDWKRGVVVATWGMVDLGTLNWSRVTNPVYVNPVFLTDIPEAKVVTTSGDVPNAICSHYKTLAPKDTNKVSGNYSFTIAYYYSGSNNINIIDNDYTDTTSFKTAMNGVMLAYELATPIEIPLGGINLLTQEGQNNIFCDTGDTEVKRLKVN